MSEHWNVQIRVQRVTKDAKTGPMGQQHAERDIVESLNLAVTADSEAEAYEKARRVLDVTIGSAD